MTRLFNDIKDGIHMVFVVQDGDILKLVIKRGLILTGIGLRIGIVGALALMGLLSGMMYHITATDSVIFIVVPLSLLIVALLACYLPVRRAARIDPMEALRYE